MRDKWIYEGKWIIFYFTKGFDISFEICGYFDNRPRINIDLFFFSLTIILPIWNNWTDECDAPKWGISYFRQTFWIHRGGKGNMKGGGKWTTFDMPWQLKWVRTSFLRKDGTWEHETKGNHKNFWEEKWKDVIWNKTYDYKYILTSGEVQKIKATIKVEEMEWRMNWFKWTSFGNKISKTIDVTFNGEVGEEIGSWKGGTIGCGYNLLPNETPLQCLRRMEKERKFN